MAKSTDPKSSQIKLLPGDIVCTSNPMAIGRLITAVERFWSHDDDARYSHSLIIITRTGLTLEALWTVKSQRLSDAYKGDKIAVYRYSGMTKEMFRAGLDGVLGHYGNWYPLHKLITNLIPPLGKYLNTGKRLICSELVGKFLHCAGVPGFKYFLGLTPDVISDRCSQYEGWETVFEGVLND